MSEERLGVRFTKGWDVVQSHPPTRHDWCACGQWFSYTGFDHAEKYREQRTGDEPV